MGSEGLSCFLKRSKIPIIPFLLSEKLGRAGRNAKSLYETLLQDLERVQRDCKPYAVKCEKTESLALNRETYTGIVIAHRIPHLPQHSAVGAVQAQIVIGRDMGAIAAVPYKTAPGGEGKAFFSHAC